MLWRRRAALTRGREEANVKKKLIVVFAVIAVVLLLIPVRKVYEDGGTQTYTSLTYKVIVWKQIDGKLGTKLSSSSVRVYSTLGGISW